MSDKWERVEGTFNRAHDDLFSNQSYSAEFFNYTTNSYDPNTGELDTSRNSIGTIQVEIVPPNMDTSVRSAGSSFSWDTSIRFPESDKPGDLVPLGKDSKRPTQVEITDPEENSVDVFELHGYSYEKGSEMIMCRLVEE